jgi:predicted DNA-binding protein
MHIEDRANVYFTRVQSDGLRALSVQTGRQRSALIREAVDFMLRNPDFFVPPAMRQTQRLVSHAEPEREAVA